VVPIAERRLGVITDAGQLRRLLANGVSHRAAARILKVSEGTIRRAVLLRLTH